MRINPHGAAAYAQTVQRLAKAAAPATTAPATAAQGGFGTLLRNEVAGVVDGLRAGEQAAVDGLLGKAGVQDVVEAVNAAELGLQKVTTVRDRVIAAYQEIMRMPI